MFFLIYASTAVNLFSQVELLSLLKKCHENNSKTGITGMLLYKDGNFMQLLEGAEEVVRQLYEKISADPRHRGIMVFLQDYQAERQFPEWSMGFRNFNLTSQTECPGYSEFLNPKFSGEEFLPNPTPAQKLLLSFKKSM